MIKANINLPSKIWILLMYNRPDNKVHFAGNTGKEPLSYTGRAEKRHTYDKVVCIDLRKEI